RQPAGAGPRPHHPPQGDRHARRGHRGGPRVAGPSARGGGEAGGPAGPEGRLPAGAELPRARGADGAAPAPAPARRPRPPLAAGVKPLWLPSPPRGEGSKTRAAKRTANLSPPRVVLPVMSELKNYAADHRFLLEAVRSHA